MWRHSLITMVFPALFVFCAVDETYGDDETPDNTAAARTLFTKGEALFEEGAYLEAAAAFQRAYELSPHPAVLSNIGYCYEYANEHAKAVTVYREYLASPFEKDADTVTDIQNRLAMLQLLVGELHIRCKPDDCTVEVDSVLKGKTIGGELAVVIAPGVYSVTVRWDDARATTDDYRVEAGEITNARFSVEKAADVEAQPKPKTGTAPPIVDVSTAPLKDTDTHDDAPNETTASLVAFYALSGGALASGIMVSVFGGLTLASKKDYKDSDYRDADARDATRRNKIITNVSIGMAAALAAGAVTVKLLDVRSKKREKRLALSLRLGGGRELSLKGEF